MTDGTRPRTGASRAVANVLASRHPPGEARRAYRRVSERALGEIPYLQFFCGEQYFQYDLPVYDASLTYWRQRTGEEVRSTR